MKLVYIAGPYISDPEPNTHAAIEAGAKIIEAGLAPFVPHLFHYVNARHPMPESAWLSLDMAYLERCDALLRLPGASKGADAEVAQAKRLGIPVFTGTEECVAWWRALVSESDELRKKLEKVGWW